MASSAARRSAAHTVAIAACAAVVSAAHGQQNPTDDIDPFHWAYSPMFGSGDYRLSDGSETHVYRGNFSVRLRDTPEEEGRGPGVRLLLPATVGLQNLDADQFPPELPPRPVDRLEQAAFAPGAELEFPAGDRWTLRTRVQLGYGEELEGAEESARLAAVGVRSRFVFDGAPGNPALINGLLWAGFETESGERRSLLRLTSALEFEVPVRRWKFRDASMLLRPHVLADHYYRPPDALGFGDTQREHVESEWQLGLAAGREGGFEVLGFDFEAVGIAYRFSDNSEGIRIYFNSVF